MDDMTELFAKIDSLDQDVEHIIDKYPRLRYFFNAKNESAAARCMRKLNVKVYMVLSNRGIVVSSYENYDTIVESINAANRETISVINIQCVKEIPDGYLYILLGNTKFSLGTVDVAAKRILMKRVYQKLNEMTVMRPILQIVAECKRFTIIIDPLSVNAQQVDPTLHRFCQGIFYAQGLLIIGARGLGDEAFEGKIIAILAHELTHFALKLTYKNHCLPYCEENLPRRLKKLIEEQPIPLKLEVDDPIKPAFLEKVEDDKYAEIIPRVVQLLVLHDKNPEKMQHYRGIYAQFIEYVDEVVLKDIEIAIPNVKENYLMLFEHRRYEYNVECKRRERRKFCMIIGLLLALLVSSCTALIFIFLNPTCESYEQLPSDKISHLKNSPMIFQGNATVVDDIFPNHDALKEVNCSFWSKVMDGKVTLEIGDVVTFNESSYVERAFPEKFYQLRRRWANDNVLLMIGEGGWGKSTSLRYLAFKLKLLFPDYWVLFIDLREHESSLNEFDYDDTNYDPFIAFMATKVLALADIQKSVFERFFRNSKTIFLFDSFDEVSSKENASEFIFRILREKNDMNVILTCNSLNTHIIKAKSRFNFTDFRLQSVLRDFLDKFLSNEVNRDQIITKTIARMKHLSQKGVVSESNLVMAEVIAVLIKSSKLDDDIGNSFGIIGKYIGSEISQHVDDEIERREIMKSLIAHNFPTFEDFFTGERIEGLKTSSKHELIIKSQQLFKHRMFEEWYLANFVIDRFRNAATYGDDDDIKLIFNMLLVITRECFSTYNSTCVFIREELRDILLPRRYVEVFKRDFKNALDSFIYELRLTNERAFEKIEFLLNFFKRDKEMLKLLLNYDDNATFLCRLRFTVENETISKIENLARNFFDDSEIERLRIGRFQRGALALEYSTKGDKNYIKKLIEDVENDASFTGKEFTDENLAMLDRNISLIEVLDYLKDNLRAEEFQEIFTTNGISRFLYPASNRRRLLTSEEFKTLKKYAENALGSAINKFYEHTAFNQINVFHFIEEFDKETLHLLLEEFSHVSAKNNKKMILQYAGDVPPFSLAVVWQSTRVENIDEFWKFVFKQRQGLATKVLKSRSKDSENTALHFSMRSNLQVFNYVRNLYQKHFHGDDLAELILYEYSKSSFLYPLIINSDNDTLKARQVWKFVLESVKSHEGGFLKLREKLLCLKDEEFSAIARPQLCVFKSFIDIKFNETERETNFKWLDECREDDEELKGIINSDCAGIFKFNIWVMLMVGVALNLYF